MIQRKKSEGVLIVREETQNFCNETFVLRCVPEARLSHRDHKSKISTPWLGATFISPPDSPIGRAVCAKHIRSDLKEVNETRTKVFVEDLRNVLESNVYVSIAPYGI